MGIEYYPVSLLFSSLALKRDSSLLNSLSASASDKRAFSAVALKILRIQKKYYLFSCMHTHIHTVHTYIHLHVGLVTGS